MLNMSDYMTMNYAKALPTELWLQVLGDVVHEQLGKSPRSVDWDDGDRFKKIRKIDFYGMLFKF